MLQYADHRNTPAADAENFRSIQSAHDIPAHPGNAMGKRSTSGPDVARSWRKRSQKAKLVDCKDVNRQGDFPGIHTFSA
jgi:hypothetical protein